MCDIVQETIQDAALVEQLYDEAFGPGRYARTAYLVREGTAPVPDLSYVAWQDGELIGSIRFNPIKIGEGGAPALMLGPLAVTPTRRRNGLGLSLIKAGLDTARAGKHRLVVLIGDLPYYAKAGFDRVPDGHFEMPGPYDPDRLLYLELEPGALNQAAGMIRGRTA